MFNKTGIKMFESDDFDEVLSGLAYPEFISHHNNDTNEVKDIEKKTSYANDSIDLIVNISPDRNVKSKFNCDFTDNQNAVKNRKRKFPGPAGMLCSGSKHKSTDSTQCILQSQDFPSTQVACAEDTLMILMNEDLRKTLGHSVINNNLYPIVSLTKGDVKSKLRGHKVPLIGGMIKSIDYSVPDPILILKDSSAEIKCLLHRDAWELFSKILLPLHSVILLYRATVFIVGHTQKKNYINITVNNIITVYSRKNKIYLPIDYNEWIKQMNNNVKKKYPNLLLFKSPSDDNSDVFKIEVNQLDINESKNRVSSIDACDGNICEQSIIQSVLDGIDAGSLFDDFIN